MTEQDRKVALIEEIQGALANLLSAVHLTEEDKTSVLKEILALTITEHTGNKEV